MRFRPIIVPVFLVATSLLTGGFMPAARSGSTSSSIQEVVVDLEAFQGYLDPAPGGMDIRYAWTLPGGKGENVTLVDIEINWNLQHNDLKDATADPVVFVTGPDPQPDININHGAAVLGELVAADDGIGVTGIAHQARVGLVSPLTEGNIQRVAQAITRAARDLEPGDVILIESQSLAGPHFNHQTGFGAAPVEYEPDIFEAIKAATGRGIVVVEPAGNGSDNLDHGDYHGAFDINARDSGAILVGAGNPPEPYDRGPDRSRTSESNYGSRVDVQGWGRAVMTCGFGDMFRDQGENNWYTDRFGATSGAAAMVAGAAALIQSIVKSRGQDPLTPEQLRRLLSSTGSPQAGNLSENIGPRPDLRAAIALLDSGSSETDPRITSLKLKNSTGKLIVNGVNFTPQDSIIEINGTPVAKHKYPSAYFLPGGTTTRIMSKRSVLDLLPLGVEVEIRVFTPSTGRRSLPFIFRRD